MYGFIIQQLRCSGSRYDRPEHADAMMHTEPDAGAGDLLLRKNEMWLVARVPLRTSKVGMEYFCIALQREAKEMIVTALRSVVGFE